MTGRTPIRRTAVALATVTGALAVGGAALAGGPRPDPAAPHIGMGAPFVPLAELARGLHRLPSVHLHTLDSPRGSFTLQAPAGWTFRAGGADDTSIAIAPARRTVPAAFIWGMLPVNAIAASLAVPNPAADPMGWVRAQFQAMAQRETAAVAVESLASAVDRGLLPQLGITDMRIVRLVSHGASAEVRVRYVFRGTPIDEHSYVRLVYLQNPAYSIVAGRPMWDTFAFAAGCSAVAGTLPAVSRSCAIVLRSFRPGATWLRDSLVAYYQNQQTQMGMVQQTVDRIYQLQNEASAALRDTTFQVGVDWAKTLGTTTDLIDPTTGDRYSVFDDTNNYYCAAADGQGVFGMDDPNLLQSPRCGSELKPTK